MAHNVSKIYTAEGTRVSSIMKLRFHPPSQGHRVTLLLVDAGLGAIDNVFGIIVSKKDFTVLIDIAPMCVGVGVFVCVCHSLYVSIGWVFCVWVCSV